MSQRGRTPQQKRDLEMETLAAQVPNQVVLEAMLRQIHDPRHRAAIRERIRPHLAFELLDNVEMHCRLAASAAAARVAMPSRTHEQDVAAQSELKGFEPLVLEKEQPCS